MLHEGERGAAFGLRKKASTVLEQDHFYSVYLVSHVTVLTNSRNRDDELFLSVSWKAAPEFLFQGFCDADEQQFSFFGHKRLSDFPIFFLIGWGVQRMGGVR